MEEGLGAKYLGQGFFLGFLTPFSEHSEQLGPKSILVT